MRTPREVAHQVAGDWIMGRVQMGELERLIATAVAMDRAHVYLDAANVAINWAGDKERGDYDALSAAAAISNAIRIHAKEVAIT